MATEAKNQILKTQKEKSANKVVRILQGKVVKYSGDKTIKVRVERKFPHSLYGKIIKSHKQYLVHYEGKPEEVLVGDEVTIKEMPKVSKKKSWLFVEKISK